MKSLYRIQPQRRSGAEAFHRDGHDLGFDLLDFWRWSASDVVSNATRGRLAEYIVARALGIPTSSVRDEWAAFDLETENGTRIEVKSAAFLQSWHQDALSKIVFRVRPSRAWNPDTNQMVSQPARHAQVYVFALLAHRDKTTVDPLNVGQWQFFVLPAKTLNQRTRSQDSITLGSLQRLREGPIAFDGLVRAVRQAAEESDEQRT
ncbi:MAG: hypothetical protein JW809_08555 [Pirellulales bacterium]|nr:hypothetical protein [Pirellulales bacterium]